MDSSSLQLQVGVKIVLKNKDGNVLLLKRSASKYPDVKEDKWDIVGGRINIGSTLLENLKREVKEETGLDLIGEPELIAAQDILKVPGRHVVRLTYVGQASGKIIIDEDHEEYNWFTSEELKKLGPSLDIYFSEVLKKGLLE